MSKMITMMFFMIVIIISQVTNFCLWELSVHLEVFWCPCFNVQAQTPALRPASCGREEGGRAAVDSVAVF